MSITTLAIIAAAVLYQNDFSTRTSAPGNAPGETWYTYRYVQGQPLADNYEGHGINYTVIAYNWKPCQDGWAKIPSVTAKNDFMMTHVTVEDDPCMIFSSTNCTINGYEETTAKDHQIYVCHHFRNVFKTGDVKLQIDMRQPVLRHGTDNIICWLRPLYEYDMILAHGDSTKSVIDVGMAGLSLTGGWRETPETPDGARTYYAYGNGLAKAGHWYRHYITIHLDTNLVDFDVYDLGTDRIGLDEVPTGSPVVTRTNCSSRFMVGDTYGGLSGFAINVQALNTELGYGAPGFTSDYSYMVDNIKGAYKANGSDHYTEFYRNTFDKSMRRTVDGSVAPSFTYTLDDPVTTTETYTARNFLVRDYSVYASSSKPYLSGVYNSESNSLYNFNGSVQDPGADGWRLMGATSFKAPVFLTTDGAGSANKVFSITSFGKNIQPMCPEVTSGICKFEIDVRMPKGFNGTPRCEFDLCSEYAYLYNNDYMPMVRVGVGASDGKDTGTVAVPNLNRGIFGAGTYYGADGDKSYGINKWYRIRATINLDTKVYDVDAYEIGDNSPANPDDFVPSNDNQMLHRAGKSVSNFAGNHTGLGSFAVCNWVQASNSNDGNDAQQFQVLFDNMRFWKQNGANWDLLYSNTGDQTKRTYTIARKSLIDVNKACIDRPEYCLDGFNVAPTYYNATYVAGANHALRFSNSFSAFTLPLGRTLRSGIMDFQYDVRLPYDANTEGPFQMYIGGAQLGSATILPSANPQRFNTGYAICSGIYNDGQDNGNGVKSVMRGVCFEGKGGTNVDKWYFTINSAAHATGKWIRVKIRANLDTKTYSIGFYDQGSTHPTFDTPDGTCIKDWTSSNIAFRWTTDPISHIYFVGGTTPSFMPWHEDAYGAVLLDNIKVCHDKQGIVYMFK